LHLSLHRDQVDGVVFTHFGGTDKRGGNDFPFVPNYTGQRKDDTGLLYYGARYYDPELGMFISPDSVIPDPGDYFSYNRYLYANGNPLKFNDPTGHCPICIAGLVAAMKAVDYGWTGYDIYQYGEVLFDPNASPEAVAQAKTDIYTAIMLEGAEPDDVLPLGIPLDDIVRHWEDISPVLGAATIRVAAEATYQAARTVNYRGVFFAANPQLRDFSKDIVVHHSVPLEVLKLHPGLFSADELNAASNLRAIPIVENNTLHLSQIHGESWNMFWRTYDEPTREQIEQFAKGLDEAYNLPNRAADLFLGE
jgi:RHS repeat-associated protein